MFENKANDTLKTDDEKTVSHSGSFIADEELRKKNEEAKKITFVKPKPKEKKEDDGRNIRFGIVTVIMAVAPFIEMSLPFVTSIIGLVCGIISVSRGEKYKWVVGIAMVVCTSDIAVTLYSLLGYLGIISIPV